MPHDVWSQLKFFRRNESWGDPDFMDPAFLIKLDRFRGHAGDLIGGVSFKVHEGYATKGHSSNSYHYKGLAVDGRFWRNGKPLSFEDHMALAMISPFGGVGIYTWSTNGTFLHFDDRIIESKRSVWVCETEGKYMPFSGQFLSKKVFVS